MSYRLPVVRARNNSTNMSPGTIPTSHPCPNLAQPFQIRHCLKSTPTRGLDLRPPSTSIFGGWKWGVSSCAFSVFSEVIHNVQYLSLGEETLSHGLKWSWCVHCTPPRHSEAFAHIASQCISSRKSTLVPPNIVDGTRIMKHRPLSTIVIPPFPKSFSSNQTSETYPRLLARSPLWPARVDQL